MKYTEYLADGVNKSILYSDYISEQINTESYSDYIAEQLNNNMNRIKNFSEYI